ncbi:hydrolase 76 protein [Podochytrium sp. JEL0797]|nr:hydrolase 76 protein [Podochytrium sp. JEL0797]
MHLMNILPLILASAAAAQGPQITLTSEDAVVSAATDAMPFMKEFYTSPAMDGAWDETIVQWHESALYWNMFFDYIGYSKNNEYNDWISGQWLLATVGGDFLDGNSTILGLAGRWNDDIGWWALASMTAAELWGRSAIVAPNNPGHNNPTYFSVTNMTYYEMLDQWTDSCGGGIYWSRNRNSNIANQKYYKSSITNAEHMELSARLFAMTQDSVYLTWFNEVNDWMKSSGIITADYTVWDGLDTQEGCHLSQLQYSYASSELVSALAIMYNTTQNAVYLTEAHGHFARIQSYFTNSAGILYDPGCEAKGSCKSPTGFLWPVYRSLSVLHGITPNATVKKDVETLLTTSAAFYFKSCQNNWDCIDVLPAGTQYTMANGTNPRQQFEIVSLLNALAVVNGATVDKDVTPGTGVATATATTKSGATRVMMWGGVVAALFVLFF